MNSQEQERKLYALLIEQDNEGVTGTYTEVQQYDWDAWRAANKVWREKYYAALKDPTKTEADVNALLEEDPDIEQFRYVEPKEIEHTFDLSDGVWSLTEVLESGTAYIEGFGTFDKVASYGGEGQGDDYWFVFSVTSPTGEQRTYKLAGWYASYDGGEYDNLFEVFPKQVMVTQWEAAN
jgi:hypothetical protein